MDFLFSISLISFKDLFVDQVFLRSLPFASSGVLELRMIFIILSRLSILTDKPINICALSSAFFKSYFVLLVITSSLKTKKFSKKSFRLHVFGFLFTIASVLNPKELSIEVNL